MWLVIPTVVFLSLQNIMQKQYNTRTTGAPVMFNLVSSLSALLFFLTISCFKIYFEEGVLWYSVAFAIAYISALQGIVMAIACGFLSLSSLLLSYSLVIPTLYGIIFMRESLTRVKYVGILLLLISLFLINKNEKSTINVKWIGWITLAFIGNGMCTVIQKMQQSAFEGRMKNEFMIGALIISCIALAVSYFANNKEKNFAVDFIKTLPYAVISGLSNGAVNLFIMILTGIMSLSVMFPTVSAGSIIITFFISKFVYKEKLSVLQQVGFVVGVLSVVLLNI